MANESEESVKDENVDQSGKAGQEPERNAPIEPVESDDAEKKVESEKPVDWKYLSRKHEKQAKENYRNWQDAKSEAEQAGERLQDALIENARLKAQRKHPELSDEDFDEFCKETDPEAIESWADAMSKRFGLGGNSGEANGSRPDTLGDKGAFADNSKGVPKLRDGSYDDSYKAAREQMAKKYASRHAK